MEAGGFDRIVDDGADTYGREMGVRGMEGRCRLLFLELAP